jgi:ankyrin repeat protein
MSHGNNMRSSSSQAQVDAAMEVNRNPLWELAEAIHCDDAWSLLKFPPLGETDSRDLSNNNEPPVEKIYTMLLQDKMRGTDLHEAILIVAASFNRVAIARAILAFDTANGVEWSISHNRALNAACANGHLEVATVIARDDDGQRSSIFDQALVLRYYCLAGDLERAQEVLTSDSLGVTIKAPLFDACRNGRCDIVALLTGDARFRRFHRSLDGEKAFELAYVNGQVEVVSMLLRELRFMVNGLNRPLRLAANAGQCDVVALLVQDERANPGLDKLFALKHHCLAGDVKRVKEALDDPDFVAAPLPGALLTAASQNGRVAIVGLMLLDPRVDPAANGNAAIQYASRHGHERVVKLLLADPRVDPGAVDNVAIRDASGNGHASVVKLLLADPRVDPTADDNDAIRYASGNGHASVVKLLLADPRVDPTADDNFAIRGACAFGNASVVELLLPDRRVDPSMGQPTALECASCEGHVDIVQMLLEHPKVVVTKAALVAADERHHGDIIRLLIEMQPRVLRDLFEGATPCVSGGELNYELWQREKASALTFLLAVERFGGFFRVSDVLREVMAEYAWFDLMEYAADDSSSISSDYSGTSWYGE